MSVAWSQDQQHHRGRRRHWSCDRCKSVLRCRHDVSPDMMGGPDRPPVDRSIGSSIEICNQKINQIPFVKQSKARQIKARNGQTSKPIDVCSTDRSIPAWVHSPRIARGGRTTTPPAAAGWRRVFRRSRLLMLDHRRSMTNQNGGGPRAHIFPLDRSNNSLLNAFGRRVPSDFRTQLSNPNRRGQRKKTHGPFSRLCVLLPSTPPFSPLVTFFARCQQTQRACQSAAAAAGMTFSSPVILGVPLNPPKHKKSRPRNLAPPTPRTPLPHSRTRGSP
jgi:hypothetical protein